LQSNKQKHNLTTMSCCNSSCNHDPCGSSFNQLLTKAGQYAQYTQSQAVAAKESEEAAEAAQAAAEAAAAQVEGFESLYLGAKDVPPALDNQGNPLQEGALYFNTIIQKMYVWDGTNWITASNVTGFNETTDFLATGTTEPRNLQDRFADVVNVKDFGLVAENTPFGRTGLRLIAGEKRDAHYAWGSIVEIPNSTKWVQIYRRGTQHGTEDGAQVRAADSYDFGLSWVNDRLIQQEATTDSRTDGPIRAMANGRIGVFCGRTSAVNSTFNLFPLFIYSDDEGVTWTKLVVPTQSASQYPFASVTGIISFPASQGGNDTTGFIAYGGVASAGGSIGAFTTVDNGNNWTLVPSIGPSEPVNGENIVIRLGNTDRWLGYTREDTVNPDNLKVFKITNLLNWGVSQDAGILSEDRPPGGFYDPTTNKVYYIGTARLKSGDGLDGYKNNLLYVSADADVLWNNNGIFNGGTLTNSYKSLLTAPNWTTGYFRVFTSKLGLCATFTAGENVANGNPPSSVWMVGNFDVNGADVGMFVDKYTRNMADVSFLTMQAVDNNVGTYPLKISNASGTAFNYYGANVTSYNAGGNSHFIAHNDGDFKETFSSNPLTPAVNVEYNYTNIGTTKFTGLNYLYNLPAKIENRGSQFHIAVASVSSAAIRTWTATLDPREHLTFHTGTGQDEVGSITTSGSTTAYNTLSDEKSKNFIGEYSAEKAIDIIKADPVREFNWKPELGGGYAIGWGAQTSHGISEDLATKGGWFKDDEEVEEGTEGAVYVPWGVDQSKRTPYLWSAVSYLVDKLKEAEERIAKLEQSQNV
jgi:hypothetical protein